MAFDNRILGRQVLSALTNKPRTAANDQVAESARKLADGIGSQNDVVVCKKFLGYAKSGAGSVKRFSGAINRTFGAASQISQDINQVQYARDIGGSVGLAEAKLFQDINNDVQKLLNTGVAKQVTKLLGASAFRQQVLRGLKLGGAVAQVGIATYETVTEYVENAKTVSEQQARRKDLIRQLGGDPTVGRFEENRATTEALNERTIFSKVADYFGFDGETQKAITSKLEARLQTVADARNYSAYFGVDALSTLQKAALSKNKQISDLTDREKNEAIDASLAESLNPDNYLNDQRVNSQIDREYEGYRDFVFESLGFSKEKRRRQLAEERVVQIVRYNRVMKRDQESYAERNRKLRADNPVENFKFHEELRNSRNNYANYLSRHQVRSSD